MCACLGACLGVAVSQVLAQANEHRVLPPHHLTATTPDQAYRADEIIPPDVAAGLRTHLLLKANTDEEALQKLSEQKSVRDCHCAICFPYDVLVCVLGFRDYLMASWIGQGLV